MNRDFSTYDQTQEGYLKYLLDTISDIYACEPTPEAISKAAYKDSACGVYVDFDDKGVWVSTIVEGSSAEYEERVVLADDGDVLTRNFLLAVNNCETFADDYIAEDYDDSMDGDHASALASAGWGTDEDYGYAGFDD